MRRFLLAALVSLSTAIYGTNDSIIKNNASISHADSSLIKEKIKLKPVPVISYAPETRLLFGVGGLAAFQLSRDTGTHYSLIAAFIAYTENNQDYIYVPYQLYTKNNKYYFEGEA